MSVVEDVKAIRGVRLAAMMDATGNVLESIGGDVDLKLIASCRAVAGSLSATLGGGELKDMVIDVEEGPVLLTSVGERLLITCFDDVANLGRIRFSLRRAVPELQGR